MADDRLSEAALDAIRADLSAWDVGPDKLVRRIEFADFPTAVRFVDALAPIAEQRQHHPDLTISWRTVTVELTTHDSDGVTDKDVELARELDTIAAALPRA